MCAPQRESAEPAVHDQDLTGDVARLTGQQEHGRVGHGDRGTLPAASTEIAYP